MLTPVDHSVSLPGKLPLLPLKCAHDVVAHDVVAHDVVKCAHDVGREVRVREFNGLTCTEQTVPKGYSKSNIAKELLQSDMEGLVGLSDGERALTTNAWLLRRCR